MSTPTAPDVRALPPRIAGQGHLRRARLAQVAWGQTPIRARLQIVRRLRHLIAARAEALVAVVGDRHGRTPADTLATEVIPLADACLSWSVKRPASFGLAGWGGVAGRSGYLAPRRRSVASL